ncbi:hypothetical protein K469DRAFT_60738 [Zopfia rhizophila CBS 207.26]|uniref:Uncharacterized protein n=1 Tax=Zopfia rhizophila CBS 207.26 TaxID=1314779 RepID=A0A6A6EDU2_9PEZI|nr:hypothetical protein K469DRAFT_60738 [Zopfia rhizophila CBS 207.26]
MHRWRPMANPGGEDASGHAYRVHVAFDSAESALEPSESYTAVPTRQLAKKKHIYLWRCCACGCASINIMVNACPSCTTLRCAYCTTTKVQVRGTGQELGTADLEIEGFL